MCTRPAVGVSGVKGVHNGLVMAGIEALAEMMEEDATAVCGARHRRHADRRGYRWGTSTGNGARCTARAPGQAATSRATLAPGRNALVPSARSHPPCFEGWGPKSTGALLVIIGIITMLYGRVMAWWHHG